MQYIPIVAFEESVLAQKFGGEYEQYKKECCSDTTWWLVSIYNTIYKIHSSPYKIVDISDDGNVYYLCIKPTIDGFIEFLKGKGRKTN